MVRSRLTCLVAIALASVFTGTAGASEQRAEPWTEPASPDTTLDQILTALRARTDTVLSVDAVTFDGVYMDSVVAGFDSTVVADGVSGAVQSKRDWERRGRFGFSLGLGNSRMRYTKVDGASLQLPIEASYSVGEFDARIGGRAGYAFASQRGRHNLGVTARYDRWRASLRHRRDIARFGSTQLHGAWLYTLAGADEQDYFERHGWVATVSRGLGPGLTAAVTYWNERQSPRSAENVFTIGSKSAASELNYPATEGRLRAIGIRLERYRREGHRFWGVIRFESAGGGLGGDMEYDQITAGLHGVSILPWDDELLLSLGTTVTSGDDAISEQALADIEPLASRHHERLDGSGYPYHHDREELPEGARVIAVADVFTALAEERPYRGAMPLDRAMAVLQEMAASAALDPDVVDTLARHLADVDGSRRDAQQGAVVRYRRMLAAP